MDDQRRFEELEERTGKLEEAMADTEAENMHLTFKAMYTNTAITFLLNFIFGIITQPLSKDEKGKLKLIIANSLNVYAKELNEKLSVVDGKGKAVRMDPEDRRKFIDGMLGLIEQVINTF
jgi:hypothetical protein